MDLLITFVHVLVTLVYQCVLFSPPIILPFEKMRIAVIVINNNHIGSHGMEPSIIKIKIIIIIIIIIIITET